jgi:hypothetical protein
MKSKSTDYLLLSQNPESVNHCQLMTIKEIFTTRNHTRKLLGASKPLYYALSKFTLTVNNLKLFPETSLQSVCCVWLIQTYMLSKGFRL